MSPTAKRLKHQLWNGLFGPTGQQLYGLWNRTGPEAGACSGSDAASQDFLHSSPVEDARWCFRSDLSVSLLRVPPAFLWQSADDGRVIGKLLIPGDC